MFYVHQIPNIMGLFLCTLVPYYYGSFLCTESLLLGHINLIVRFSSSRLQIFNEARGNLKFKFV